MHTGNLLKWSAILCWAADTYLSFTLKTKPISQAS
jgi:hypothetical protein